MIEFEKWFKKNKPYDTYSCMDMAEKAWVAAMETVLLWGSDDDVLFDKIKDEIYGG